MNRWQLDCKDVMEWCKEYTGPKFHSLLADPPYSLRFMNKKWDDDIAFRLETWAALSEHLLPGAFIFVFGSSRGWHRLAVAIEDAGFVFHPSLMVWGWVNAAGFPKATRIDTQIDRAAGEEREVIGHNDKLAKRIGTRISPQEWSQTGNLKRKIAESGSIPITAPATPLARAWQGHRYGRQALKPAVEMIICAQKPYSGRPVDSIVETGAGSLWIDGGRVGVNDNEPNFRGNRGLGRSSGGFQHPYIGGSDEEPIEDYHQHSGRWPPNFALCHVSPSLCATCDGDGCDECGDTGLVGGCRRVGTKRVKGVTGGKEPHQHSAQIFSERVNRPYFNYADANGYEETAAWQCCESCAARRIGEQAGPSVARPTKPENIATSGDGEKKGLFGNRSKVHSAYYDTDAQVTRFFPQFGWAAEIAERLAAADQVRYCAKAGRSEREEGLAHTPIRIMHRMRPDKNEPTGLNKEPRWAPTEVHNPHPTVKPISLCRWLATLLLPPPEYAPRRILVPFAGVASEMIAAGLAGWEFVQGIEMSEEYCEIGEARLAWWLRQLRLPGMEGV